MRAYELYDFVRPKICQKYTQPREIAIYRISRPDRPQLGQKFRDRKRHFRSETEKFQKFPLSKSEEGKIFSDARAVPFSKKFSNPQPGWGRVQAGRS